MDSLGEPHELLHRGWVWFFRASPNHLVSNLPTLIQLLTTAYARGKKSTFEGVHSSDPNTFVSIMATTLEISGCLLALRASPPERRRAAK